ncbi:MAG: single-stranded DNA-binding protein [Corallococcus sp.]|nr:single-stranded DNA-binding protein [Corallococcus sp.]
MNRWCGIGNLTRDVETRATGQHTVAKFTIAINTGKDSAALFIDVNAWNQLGQNCAKFLRKGSKVGVVGRINVYSYEHNGENRKGFNIEAEQVEFLSAPVAQTAQEPETVDTLKEQQVVDDDMPF